MKTVAILLLMLTVALVGLRFVWAHEGASGITKERMDAMETMARAMKAIRRPWREIATAPRFRTRRIVSERWQFVSRSGSRREVMPSRPMPCQPFGNAGRIFRREPPSLSKRAPSWWRWLHPATSKTSPCSSAW